MHLVILYLNMLFAQKKMQLVVQEIEVKAYLTKKED